MTACCGLEGAALVPLLTSASAVLGGIGLLVWLRQREAMYFSFAMAQLLWALHIGDPPVLQALPASHWSAAVHLSAQCLSTILVFRFALEAMGIHHRGLRRLVHWHLWLTPCASWVLAAAPAPWLAAGWVLLTHALAVLMALHGLRHAGRHQDAEYFVLLGAAAVMVAAVLRDTAVTLQLDRAPAGGSFGTILWQHYAWPLLGFVLVWMIADRMGKAASAVAAVQVTLEKRLAECDRQLEAAFIEQSCSMRRQATLEERQRLAFDMHDGLGRRLLGALELARNARVSQAVLAEHIRATLDHLKLTVDAMQYIEGDITGLLGAVRYRLRRRLEQAGVRLAWSVDALPTLPGWTLQHSRHLQSILFGALAALQKHGGGTDASLAAEYDRAAGQIRITIDDHGARRGAADDHCSAMALHAAQLNASIQFKHGPAGTTTVLAIALGGLAAAGQA